MQEPAPSKTDKKSEVQSVSDKKIPLDVLLDFLQEQARQNKHYAYLDRTAFKTSEVAIFNYFKHTDGQISISYDQKENRLSYTSTSSSEESLWEIIRLLSEEIKQFGKSMQVQLKPADAEAKKIMEEACKHYGLTVSSSVTTPSKEANPMEEMMRQMQGQGMPKPPGKR